MFVRHLASVDGDLVVDLDGDRDRGDDVRCSTPVRVADDVTLDHVRALARAVTYRAAVFEERLAGAAIGVRPRLVDAHHETVARLIDELAADTDGGHLVLEADLGTTAADVAAREHDPGRTPIVAAEAWLQGLERRTVAVEGFDARSESAARAAVARGATVVGVSSRVGAVADGAGLDLDALCRARDEHGPAFVTHLGLDVHPPADLLGLAVDVLVTSGGAASIDAEAASSVQARVLSPSTAAPYTAAGLDVLRRRQVVGLPDFVSTAGPFLEDTAPGGLTDGEVRGRADRLVAERTDSARLAKVDPYRYATTLAGTYLATWAPDRASEGPLLDG